MNFCGTSNFRILLVAFPLVCDFKCIPQALTDRASRGLSLMPGFKSRQEKAAIKVGVFLSLRVGGLNTETSHERGVVFFVRLCIRLRSWNN